MQVRDWLDDITTSDFHDAEPYRLCRVGPHIVTNYHCVAKLAKDTTNTQVLRPVHLFYISIPMHTLLALNQRTLAYQTSSFNSVALTRRGDLSGWACAENSGGR